MSTQPENQPGNENGGGSAAVNYVNLLVIGTDIAFARQVLAALQTVQADNKDKTYRVFPGANKEKALEVVEKYQLHSIIVDEVFIQDTTPDFWVRDFRDALKKFTQNATVPIVFACMETNGERTRALVNAGWRDVFLKPLDTSLFIQKMHIFNPAIPLLTEDLLFTWDTDRPADVALRFKVRKISEFGMTVEATTSVSVGSIVSIKTDFLETALSAQVLECKKSGDTNFALELIFIGLLPSETQAIRKFIRQEYAEEKQAA